MNRTDTRRIRRAACVGFGVCLAVLSVASVRGQNRRVATPQVPAPPPASLPMPNVPNPYLVEIGALKQEVASLQQTTLALEGKVALLEQTLLKLSHHRHDTGLGFTTWKTIQAGTCPDCVMPFAQPGKAPQFTSEPK